MAQVDKIIEVSKSFVVVDPNAFTQNLDYTRQEDQPIDAAPVLAFDGQNFMPTSYGYKSFFGANSVLDISALPARCDRVLSYQFANLQNVLVALCDDGIYISKPAVQGSAWVRTASRTAAVPPTVLPYLPWTTAIIENVLYMYQQGGTVVYKITPTSIDLVTGVVTVATFTPSFLNMAGQMGIFRANARLGFWDSANSVSWSDLANLADMTPSLETRAGNTIFNAVKGRIVTILPQGDGFVIYTTKGIVGVHHINDVTMLWDATAITGDAGIAYSRQVCTGLTDLEHFAFTNTGIKHIGAFDALSKSHKIQEIIPDVYDLLKESRTPVYLQMLNGRHLFLCVIDGTYLNGRTLFQYDTLGNTYFNFKTSNVAGLDIPAQTIGGSGLSLLQNAANQAAAGITVGMYMRWDARGEAMVFDRPATPINPYNTDSWSAHVPNAIIDSSAYVKAADWSLILDGTKLYSDPVRSAFPANGNQNLAWVYPGANQVASNLLGVIDTSLTEFFNTQIAEWNNFQTVQSNTVAELAAVPALTSPDTRHTPFTVAAPNNTSLLACTSDIDAHLLGLMNTLAAQHPGATVINNSFVRWDVAAGQMLYGQHTVAGPTVTNPGTTMAEASMTATFTGGYQVARRTDAQYSFQSAYALVNQAQSPEVNAAIIDIRDNLIDSAWLTPPLQDDPWATVQGERGYVYWNRYTTYSAQVVGTLTMQDAIQLATQLIEKMPATITVGGITYSQPRPAAYIQSTLNLNYNAVVEYFPVGTVLPAIPSSIFATTYTSYYGYNVNTTVNIGTQYPTNGAVGAMYIIWQPDKGIALHSTSTYPWLTWDDTMTYVSTSRATQTVLEWGMGAAPNTLPNMNGLPMGATLSGLQSSGWNIPPIAPFSYPGATFLMQDGAPEPEYPTFQGAFVMDTALQKWGKMVRPFKAILDYSPINYTAVNVTYTNFGVDMAILDGAGAITAMDAVPLDSWLMYGKVGYYRLGMTKVQEIKAQFRTPFTGTITTDGSLDGKVRESLLSIAENFTQVYAATAYANAISGRWYTITISGNFDLSYLEFRGNVVSRR